MTNVSVVELLADIRGLMGADTAALWRASAEGTHELMVYSTSKAGAPVLDVKRSGVVTWAAQQEPGELSSDGDPVVFLATPVPGGEKGWVLTVQSDSAIGMDRTQYRRWMPRFAARAGALASLVATNEVATRAERQAAILLDMAPRLHEHRNVEMLGDRICTAALEMTGAKRAALVQWRADTKNGEIAFATRGH